MLLTGRTYLDPDDQGAAVSDPIAPPPEAAPPSPQPSPEPSNPQAGPPPGGSWSVRGFLKEKGLPSLAQLDSDEAAAGQLIDLLNNLHQERSQLQDFHQRVSPRWSEFEKWQAAQDKPAQPEPEPLWKAPEFDQRWLQFVSKDAYGQPTLLPGAPPDLLHKIDLWKQHHNSTLQKFVQNPIEFLQPLLKDTIREQAQELLNSYRGELETKMDVDRFVRDNTDWMFEHDEHGRMRRGPDGRPLASPYGQDVFRNIQEIEQMQGAEAMPYQSKLNLAIKMTNRALQGFKDPRQAYTGQPPAAPPVPALNTGNTIARAGELPIPQNDGNDWKTMAMAEATRSGLI